MMLREPLHHVDRRSVVSAGTCLKPEASEFPVLSDVSAVCCKLNNTGRHMHRILLEPRLYKGWFLAHVDGGPLKACHQVSELR